METNRHFAQRFDWTLAIIIFIFMCISLTAISSAQTSGQYSANYVILQLRGYIIGAFIVAIVMFFEPSQYKKFTWYLYGFGVFLLFMLFVIPKGGFAVEINGAKSWFKTPIGNIQPAEFMKTFYILGLAWIISKHHELSPNRTFKSDLILLAKMLGVLIIPLFFIMKQPDLGSALVFLAITAALIIIAGVTWKIIIPVFLAASGIGATLLWMALYNQDFIQNTLGFDAYQLARIYSWLDPYSYAASEGYHLITSLNAIGSGEIFGKGYGGREVYVAENHTDFIFAVIGEEWGFIGASFVICMYFLLVYHLTKIAIEMQDSFCTYVCAGVIAMITFHVIENIGMTIQLLPITGIPLPLISYGGSSMMGISLALGLIFSMKFHHRSYMFGDKEQ